MPEGPEVLITAQYLFSKLKNKIIYDLNIIDNTFEKKVEGYKLLKDKHKIINIDTRGKVMWFKMKNIKTDKILYMFSHFGLTGEWGFEENKFTRFEISINGTENKLYYSDQIKFGKISISKNSDNKMINKIAPDLLKEYDKTKDLVESIINFRDKKHRTDKILGFILTQQEVNKGFGSGIGYYLACEILYRSELSPHRKLSSLSDDDIKNLAYWIRYTMKLAYYYNTSYYIENISKSFIEKHHDGIFNRTYPDYCTDIKIPSSKKFKYLVYGLDKDKYNNPITKDKNINKGRTFYWVKKIQA